MAPFKKVPAYFYAAPGGEEPVRTWLKELRPEDRKIVGKDIQKVEFGWPVGLPTCSPLGSGLWEVRINLTSNRISRVIFGFKDNTLVLLHAFVKKTQGTPKQDIQLALSRLRSMKSGS